jgi:hypothetical protein
MRLNTNSSLQTNAEEVEAEDTTAAELEVLEEAEDSNNNAISHTRDQLQLKQKTMLKMQQLDKKNRLYKQL